MRLAIALLLLSSQCHAVEQLKAEGTIKVKIVAQEIVQCDEEIGTVIYDENGAISQIIF